MLHFVQNTFSKDASYICILNFSRLDEGGNHRHAKAPSELKHAFENDNMTKFWIDCIDADKFPNAKIFFFVLNMSGSMQIQLLSHEWHKRVVVTNERLHHFCRLPSLHTNHISPPIQSKTCISHISSFLSVFLICERSRKLNIVIVIRVNWCPRSVEIEPICSLMISRREQIHNKQRHGKT